MNANTFSFNSIPQNVEQFKSLPEFNLSTPFETAALTVVALCRYAEDSKSGTEMLNALKGPQPLSTAEIRFLEDRFRDGLHIPRSYIAGSSPQNDYTPNVPLEITVSENPYTYSQAGYAKMFITSSGADTARTVTLRQKGDNWFLWEQALMVGIRTPESKDAWS